MRAYSSIYWHLAIAVSSVIGFSCCVGAENTQTISIVCAQREVAVITLIEDHAEVEDVVDNKLTEAYLAMLRARATCYAGRTDDAIAAYDEILKKLGPLHIGRMR